MERRYDYESSHFSIARGLRLFLFGMKIMSEGFQKVAGKKMCHIIKQVRQNEQFPSQGEENSSRKGRMALGEGDLRLKERNH
jgi:uncharacterized protein (DUF169 family)